MSAIMGREENKQTDLMGQAQSGAAAFGGFNVTYGQKTTPTWIWLALGLGVVWLMRKK